MSVFTNDPPKGRIVMGPWMSASTGISGKPEAYLLDCPVCGPWWVVACRSIAITVLQEHAAEHPGCSLFEGNTLISRGEEIVA